MFVSDSQNYFNSKPPRSYYIPPHQDEVGQGGAVGFFGDDIIPAVDIRQQVGWYPFAHTDLEEVLAAPVSPQHQCAGNVVDDSSTGTVAWSNPGNAIGRPDGISATVSLSLVNPNSHYLKTSRYGFNIPPGVLVLGFVITARVAGQVGAITDNQVRMVKGGFIGSTNRSNGTVWPNTLTDETYGGATDLFGDVWSPADVNRTDFGCAIAAVNTLTGTHTASVDAICIDVYFAPVVIDDEPGTVFVQSRVWQPPIPWDSFAYSDQEDQISHTPPLEDDSQLVTASTAWTVIEWAIVIVMDGDGLLQIPVEDEQWIRLEYHVQIPSYVWTAYIPIVHDELTPVILLKDMDEIIPEVLPRTQIFQWSTTPTYWLDDDAPGLKNFFLEEDWGASSTQLFQWLTYPTYWLEDDATGLKNFFLEEDWGGSTTQLLLWLATPTYWLEDDAPGLKFFSLEDEWWVRVEYQTQLSSYIWLPYIPPYETDVGNAGLKNFFLEEDWGASTTQAFPWVIIFAPPFEFDVGNAGLGNFFLEDEWGGSSSQVITWNSVVPNVDPIDLAIAFILDDDNGNMPGFTLVSWTPFALMVEEFQQQIFSVEDEYLIPIQLYTVLWTSIPIFMVGDENFVAFHIEDEFGLSATQLIPWFASLSPSFEMDADVVPAIYVEDEWLLPPQPYVQSWYAVIPIIEEIRHLILGGEDEWSQSSLQSVAWSATIPIVYEEIGIGFGLEDDQQPFTVGSFQQTIQWESKTLITDEVWLSGALPVTTPAVLFQLIAYNPGLEQCTAFNPGMQQSVSGA